MELITKIRARLPRIETQATPIIEARGGSAELLLHDTIGFPGITSAMVVEQLKAVKGNALTVRINSPGGDVFDGLAIYEALKSWPGRVTARVEGLAASAATFPLMAAERVEIGEHAFIMIHRSWALSMGSTEDMTAMAGLLAKIDDQLAALYARRTGKSTAEMLALMDAETWFNAEEAKAAGFADVILSDALASAAAIALPEGHFKNAPAALVAKGSPDPADAERRRRMRMLLAAQ